VDECDGDRLATVVRQAYPSLRAFAAGVARDDPDDVVQEALVRLLQRGSVDKISDVVAYLRRVVVSVAIDRARRDRARRRAQDRSGPPVVGVEAVYPSDVAELMMLDVRSRALLYLTEIEGACVAEAAAAVGCSAPAARMRLSRARRRLRHLLEEEGDDTATRRVCRIG
jgi:RNA polymerase sigma-70 factor (ECF subfamily)